MASDSPGAAVARVYRVGVQNADLLTRLAARHSLEPGRIAELILNAAFETGDTFCENLLDLKAGQ